MNNYYEILEISPNASQEVIEKAYKALALKYHPDSWPKDKKFFAESKFREITDAYQVLSNEYTRRNYDIKIGLNDSFNEKYNELYLEHEQLKQEINNMRDSSNNKKTKKNKKISNERQALNNMFKSTAPSIKELFIGVKDAIKNESNKPEQERKKDIQALFITLIIVSIIVFLFFKVPFLKKILFP